MKRYRNWISLLLVMLMALPLGPTVWAQEDDAPEAEPAAPAAQEIPLSVRQERLGAKYERFEQILIRLAELTAKEDPERAELLRKVVSHSKQQGVRMQFEDLARLLGGERPDLDSARNNQQGLEKELETILALLLSEDLEKKRQDDIRRAKEYLERVERLIQEQRGQRNRTESDEDIRRLADGQGRIADDAGNLSREMQGQPGEGQEGEGQEGEGKPGEGKPGEGRPSEGKPGEGMPGEGEPGEGMPGEGEPGEGKPGEGKPGEGKPGEGEPGEGKPGEGKPGEGKPGEGEPGEGKPGEGEPGEGKPGEGKPGEGKPGEGKPGEGKPGEGKPGEGQPGQGQPGQGQPGEGQSGQSPPPGSESESFPGRERVAQAEQRMREAQQKLEEAKREGAIEAQEAALRELEAAKAELEEILRQLRKEELERMLAQLEARFRKMLEMQIEVYERTLVLDQRDFAQWAGRERVECQRLSVRESEIVLEADRALTVLREDGSAVAFPEAVNQMRDDMDNVTRRLAQMMADEPEVRNDLYLGVTVRIEEDIIAALEETIAALEKAQKELQEQESMPMEGMQGQPGDQPLIDMLAELKMIRALQDRVNRRTLDFSEMIGGEQARDPDMLNQLKGLADREERIYSVTRDIVLGRNQ
jgi:hypothetical protein